jgi:hypothetical protein
VIIDGANPVEIPDRVIDIRFLGGVGEVGRSVVLVDDGETRLLYTGDFHTDDQRLVAVLLGEVKYSDAEHTFKQGLEELLTYQRFAPKMTNTSSTPHTDYCRSVPDRPHLFVRSYRYIATIITIRVDCVLR